MANGMTCSVIELRTSFDSRARLVRMAKQIIELCRRTLREALPRW